MTKCVVSPGASCDICSLRGPNALAAVILSAVRLEALAVIHFKARRAFWAPRCIGGQYSALDVMRWVILPASVNAARAAHNINCIFILNYYDVRTGPEGDRKEKGIARSYRQSPSSLADCTALLRPKLVCTNHPKRRFERPDRFHNDF